MSTTGEIRDTENGTPMLDDVSNQRGTVVANDTAQIRPMSHASQVGLEQTKRKPV